MKHIAVECESLEDTSWGMARQVRGLLQELANRPALRDQYRIHLYFKSRIPEDPWLKDPIFIPHVLRPFRWFPASFSLYFYVFFPLRVLIDQPEATYIANYMLPLIFFRKSIVMLTEDIWLEMRAKDLPFRYRLAYNIFATWAAKHATRIMAISHASAQGLAKLFRIAPERIAVNELAVAQPQQAEPRPGNYFLYVAQALKRRHLRETILAFREIAPKHPGLDLVAVGPDKYRPAIIADLVEETNRILGRTAVIWKERVGEGELASAFRGARALIYVSDMEAFGLPPLEALSYGTPSILMDAPVHREIFGNHAFFVSTPDTSSIAAAMERVMEDASLAQRIREASPAILEKYTWKAHADRFLNIVSTITDHA